MSQTKLMQLDPETE